MDPQLRAVLGLLPNLGALSAETLPAMRASLAPAVPSEPPPGLSIWRVDVPGLDGEPAVSGLLYAPQDTKGRRPALLHLHGGGYVGGSAQRDDPAVRQMAQRLGAVVLSLDYRLAPETAYPGALHDAWAGLAWLHAQAKALDIDPARVAVRGNSAGGGLAAGLALLARDRGEHPIAFLALVYPMLDDRTAAHPFCGRHVWTHQANLYGWAAYLGELAADPPATAAPGRAVDLTGLPPTWIGCGDIDLFVEEDLAFAQRLARAGVPVEVHVYAGAFHGFNLIPGVDVARRFDRDLFSALSRALGVEESSE
jgi:acetyl esterase/lipase